ncbi:MAG: hypothetical protein IPN33_01435 [Saprospiraceae bacterium]|nr:hypothetical protein [Saprospiraceae bacterium]
MERHEQVSKWRHYMHDRFRGCQFKEPALNQVYQSKIYRALELLRRFKGQWPQVDLPVAMDHGYTSGQSCKIIGEDLKMAYVGSLADYQMVILSGSEKLTLGDFVKRLKQQQCDGQKHFYKTTVHYKGRQDTYWAYCATHRIQGFEKQRLIISFNKEDLSDKPTFSISNRTHWHASGILRIRRHRWPVETFHQESKAEGLDKYQLRDFEAIKTHIAFVSTAYTMLKRAIHDDELLSQFRHWFNITEPPGSLPWLRRLIQLEGLLTLVEFVYLQVCMGQSLHDVLCQLMQPAAS